MSSGNFLYDVKSNILHYNEPGEGDMSDEVENKDRPDTWQNRLYRERSQLSERLMRLELFQASDEHEELSAADIFLLDLQQVGMKSYVSALNQRIKRLSYEC